MANNEEKMRILNMVQEGKLSAEEASQLLEALDFNPEEITIPFRDAANTISKANGRTRWVRIQVTDLKSGKHQVNVKLPMGIIKVGAKAFMRVNFKDEDGSEINLDELLREALEKDDSDGVLVDVEDSSSGQHVLITLE